MALDRPVPQARYSTRLIRRVQDAAEPWRERGDVLVRRIRITAIAAFLVLLATGTALAVRRASAVPIESLVPLARTAVTTTVVSAQGSLPSTSDEAPTASPLPVPPATGPDSAVGTVPSTTTGTPLVVHAAGAVRRPGVVVVRPGSRVDDVVEAAGGATASAELDGINLAAPVEDGERVFVPFRGRPPVTVVSAAGGGLVASGGQGPASDVVILDLNAATVEQLDTLPGVGPATAGAIVEFRTAHGPFRSVTQLLEVPGIGDAKLARIRPRVRV